MHTGNNISCCGGMATRRDREAFLNQKGCVVWFTGLSGAGKTTIAHALEERLMKGNHLCYVLDGDSIRSGLNADLGFSPEDRNENIRRLGEVAALFSDAGLIAITSFISPYRADRRSARNKIGNYRFIEVFLDVPLEICEQRDPRKLYKKARTGIIPEFTGISAPYEAPECPELVLDTSEKNVASCVTEIIEHLVSIDIFGNLDE